MRFDRFKELVDELTEEWGDGHNMVTCEFSTSSEDFEEKDGYIGSLHIPLGYWHIVKCTTCSGHDPNTPWHVSITEGMGYEESWDVISDHRIAECNATTLASLSNQMLHDYEMYSPGILEDLVQAFFNEVENPQWNPAYLAATLELDEWNNRKKELETLDVRLKERGHYEYRNERRK